MFTPPDGSDAMGVRGTYDEIERPHLNRLHRAVRRLPCPQPQHPRAEGNPDRGTAMTLTVRYLDRETRHGWIASGMTEGLGRGYQRLDEALDAIS
jgi:hypothetical protein